MNDDRISAWIDEHWQLDLKLAEWWDLLAGAGYAFPTWPDGLGGSAAPMRRGAQGARRAVGRRRHRSAGGERPDMGGPTVLAHGTEEQQQRFLAPLAAAARRGPSCSPSPAQAPTWPAWRQRRPRRRRVHRQRSEGLELVRRLERLGHAPGSHEPRRPQAPRDHVHDDRDGPAGRRGAAAGADERCRRVLRSVPHRCPCPGRQRDRRSRATDGTWPAPRSRTSAPTPDPAGRRGIVNVGAGGKAGNLDRDRRRTGRRGPKARRGPSPAPRGAAQCSHRHRSRRGAGRWNGAGRARPADALLRQHPGLHVDRAAQPRQRPVGPARPGELHDEAAIALLAHESRDLSMSLLGAEGTLVGEDTRQRPRPDGRLVEPGGIVRRRHQRDPAEHHWRAHARPPPRARPSTPSCRSACFADPEEKLPCPAPG